MASVFVEIRRQDFLNCEACLVPTNRKDLFEKCDFRYLAVESSVTQINTNWREERRTQVCIQRVWSETSERRTLPWNVHGIEG